MFYFSWPQIYCMSLQSARHWMQDVAKDKEVETGIIKLCIFGPLTHKRVTSGKVRATLTNLKTNETVNVAFLETPYCMLIKHANGRWKNKTVSGRYGLEVADTPVRGMESEGLGIWINGVHYRNLVWGCKKRLDNGQVAVESKFGWLIQGCYVHPCHECHYRTSEIGSFSSECWRGTCAEWPAAQFLGDWVNMD